MAKYLIGVDFQPGIVDTPMSEWEPAEVQAHLDYYGALQRELVASGELVESTILTGPDLAKIVRSDGGAPVVTDGPFQEFKEWLAGFQIVEVDSEERAIEIAAKVSAVPGPGGIPFGQPIHVRRVMDDTPSSADEMDDFLRTAEGAR
ncbi:MAG TPA: YciI family protein [Humibacillus sp.]|nr:YciI family protein [Humibacillus sp.]